MDAAFRSRLVDYASRVAAQRAAAPVRRASAGIPQCAVGVFLEELSHVVAGTDEALLAEGLSLRAEVAAWAAQRTRNTSLPARSETCTVRSPTAGSEE